MTLKVGKDRVVKFEYVLALESGDVVDSSEGHEPLAYLHGYGNIIPGLERQMEGMEVGEEREIVVEPGEAYGEYIEGQDMVVPLNEFPANMTPEVGMGILVETPDGQQIPYFITEIQDGMARLDPNHPLAGQRLHFKVKVVDIREATEEEKAHGHVHEGDHHH